MGDEVDLFKESLNSHTLQESLDTLKQKLISTDLNGEVNEPIERLKVLLSVAIINLKDKKSAKDSDISKLVNRFNLKELFEQMEWLDKRFSNPQKIEIIHKLQEKRKKGVVITPEFFYDW